MDFDWQAQRLLDPVPCVVRLLRMCSVLRSIPQARGNEYKEKRTVLEMGTVSTTMEGAVPNHSHGSSREGDGSRRTTPHCAAAAVGGSQTRVDVTAHKRPVTDTEVLMKQTAKQHSYYLHRTHHAQYTDSPEGAPAAYLP